MPRTRDARPLVPAVELWVDPVCPFSWNTAKWLAEVAMALFDAITVLANTPEFSQLERPRAFQGSH